MTWIWCLCALKHKLKLNGENLMKHVSTIRGPAQGLHLFLIAAFMVGLAIGIVPPRRARAISLYPVLNQSTETMRTIR